MSILEDHRRFREIIKGRIKQHFKKYVTQGEMIGKQEKEFAGLPPKGNSFDSEHIFILRFNESGIITDLAINWDHESFVNQLTK